MSSVTNIRHHNSSHSRSKRMRFFWCHQRIIRDLEHCQNISVHVDVIYTCICYDSPSISAKTMVVGKSHKKVNKINNSLLITEAIVGLYAL
jgi:uncharacterized Zn-finger protein